MTSAKNSGFDLNLAQQVAPSLKNIAVHTLTVVANRAPATEYPKRLNGQLSAANDGEGTYWFRHDPNVVVAVFPFSLTITDATSQNEVGSVFLQYQIVYAFDPASKLDDAAIETFVALYGTVHLWPYLRSDVQALVSKIELPTLTLPILNMGQLPHGFSIRQLGDDEIEAGSESAPG